MLLPVCLQSQYNMSYMYKRGPYYQPRRHFPLLPRESVAIAAALLVGVTGIYGLSNVGGDNPQELAGRAASRQGHDTKAKKSAVKPTTPQSLIKAADTVGVMTNKPVDLSDPAKKELAMRLVSSAENSSLNWRDQFAYIEDIGDGRGYTAGIIGFCSGTGDMLALVEQYTKTKPGNLLEAFLPALRKVNGTSAHTGLETAFIQAWKTASADPLFQQAQEHERDKVYFDPAVAMAKADGLGTLGQFAYYDAAVMHGPDAWGGGLPDIRAKALQSAKPPTQGGAEATYLQAFLSARRVEMAKEAAHRDVSRIDTTQLAFLQAGNMGLNLPLNWKMYGDSFSVTSL